MLECSFGDRRVSTTKPVSILRVFLFCRELLRPIDTGFRSIVLENIIKNIKISSLNKKDICYQNDSIGMLFRRPARHYRMEIYNLINDI